MAVLRYDDRGTAQSTGNFKNSTSLDFATDALAAVNYLLTRKEINKQKIGLIGHSEGGLIAPIVATNSKNISFIVLLAGPGLPGNQLLLLQQKTIAEAAGMSDAAIQKAQEINKTAFNIIAKSKSPEQLKTDITAYMTQVSKTDPNKPAGMTEAEYIKMQTDKILTPWMVTFLTFNPAPTLEKVKCPVLALNGAKDLQVAPKENLTTIKEALLKGGNKNITIKELPNLNHLFQECKTGLPQEYATIEQTFAPIALNEILDWIKIQTK
ncbi:S9 family peptidase [Flavobacterium sp. 140616W15]|uniref:alpha/beta hydrolase family protein n=1 Tax=Flavobacterium sp. 140616W15 TaxID=2478552 RepID=UPI001F5CD389|nr:alpha/beta hydrolase [Flavobacterium sp. 140616W15]